jgi:N-acetyl-anhydromuramyl-L-alanine amidase AmpD
MRLHQTMSAALAALALSACGAPGSEAGQQPVPPSTEGSQAQEQQALDGLFEQAAAEFGVSADVLKAVSFVETRWEMVRGGQEFEGRAPAYGLLALRGAALERAAELAGVTVEEARTQPLAHLRAGAALLSAYADELGVDRKDLGAWAPAVARFSGIEHPEARAQYIHSEVYGVLRQGAVAYGPGEQVRVSLFPTEVQARYEQPPKRALAAGPDYASSIWRASPNFNSRSGYSPQMIVIHTCEGGYSGCWSWLSNSSAGASAHYVVNESGTEISQLVREADRAWHVAASYDCGLNGSVKCNLNGVSVNHFSVGIEHGGYASQTSFPTGQIDASAKLSCDISRDRNIPRDSYHIVSHGRLQPATRTDPGPNWPWSTYLSKVNGFCGTTNTVGLVVDSNNANNDSTKGYVQVSANWTAGANTGYYGNNYYTAPTAAVSDPFVFHFYMAAAGTRTIDAWWVAASNRSTTAPFVITDANGNNLATVNVNQQLNGGQWNTLGTWSFPAGWNKVQLSRWTTSGFYVVADAIQVR